MKTSFSIPLLALWIMACSAFAVPPTDQNFDALSPQESVRDGSLTFSGVTYSTDATNDALRVDTIANVTGNLPSLGFGNGLSSVWYGTNTGTYLQFASVNQEDDFRIVSFNAEVWGNSSQNSELYTITGYDNDTQVASATVNFRLTGTYGAGANTISYTRLTTPAESSSSLDGANAGTLSFTGGGWGKVDRVRMTVADTHPNTILGMSIDLLDFEAPTGATTAPTVTTATQSGVTHNSATLGGEVTADGGAAVTESGIVWGTSAYPTTSNNKVQIDSGTGAFSQLVTGLPSSATVHVRAYAINSAGTAYGGNISFTTSAAPVAVSSLNRANATPSNAAAVNWTLTFASVVTGVSASNFSLAGAAAAGASIGTPTTGNGGLSWTVPVTTGGTDGELTLRLANATGLSSPVSGLPYDGQSYTMDKTPPQVQSVARHSPAGQTMSSTSVTFRVTYTEPVTGISAARYAVVPVGGSSITGTVTGVTPVSASVYDVAVTLTSGTGEFRLRVVD